MGRKRAIPTEEATLARQLRQLRKIARALGYQEAEAWIKDELKQPIVWAEGDDQGPRAMLLEGARRRGLRVVRCSLCEQPAASLDTFHPFEDDFTLCLDHYKAR